MLPNWLGHSAEWFQISLSCFEAQAGALVRYSEVGQFFRLISVRTCTWGV